MWTTITGTPGGTPGAGDIFADPSAVWLGAFVTAGRELIGELRRVIVRNGIGGPAVLDVHENDAGKMGPHRRSWRAAVQTVTVNGSVAPIVQPQTDRVVWRFDANEWPVGAASLDDPRGRAWTASNGATVADPASVPDEEISA